MAMEKFHYETEDGRKITLPKFDQVMTIGFARKNRKLPQDELAWVLLEKAADAKTLEAIDEMSMAEFEPLMKAWQSDSNISLGESSAS